jgi:hypothetical protein
MAKIGGLAGVSTEFKVAPDGEYEVEVRKVNAEVATTKSKMIVIQTMITEEGEQKGTIITERYVYEDPKGQPVEAGMRNLKKRAIEMLGDEDLVNSEDFDTDMLLNWVGKAQVKLETYKKKDRQTQQETGEEGMTNRIVRYFR